MNKALANPEVKARLAAQGVTPESGSVAAFSKVFMADYVLMSKVVKDAKLSAE